MANVTGDSRLQTDVLEDLSDAHRYRRWLAELALPYLGPDPVEIGSGRGDYAIEWAPHVRRFTATEGDESRLAALSARFADHPTITIRRLLLGEPAAATHRTDPPGPDRPGADRNGAGALDQHSAAVAINVLEHIPDDVGALRAMAALVRPGGSVVLLVPAFPSAMSRFDRAIGHQRRYTRAGLRAAFDAAGLPVRQLRYVNPLGLLGWYVTAKALGMTPRNGPLLRAYDATVVPLARFADARLHPPFGQSVFAVATVPGEPVDDQPVDD